MLNNVAVQMALLERLQELIETEILPQGTKAEIYAGQIDIVQLNVDMGGAEIAIFINWLGDSPGEEIAPVSDEHSIRFSLLICTRAVDLSDALGIIDTLSGYDENEVPYFLGEWEADGERLWDVYREDARPVFNLKRKQVISFPVRVVE